MKRIVLLMLLTVFSQSQAQSQQGELQLSLYNDSWGGGFTSMYDDLRTYHLQVGYAKGSKYKLYGKYSLLTNRFDEDTLQRKAFNELVLNTSFSVVNFNKGKGGNISLKAGVFIIGDLLGSQIQEATHKVFGVTQTNLDYYEEQRVSPSIGYNIEKTVVAKELKERAEFQLKLNQSIEHAINYITNLSVSSSFFLKNHDSQIIATAGYYKSISHLDNKLASRVSSAETGLGLGLKVESKRLFYHFQTFPSSNFSYGGAGIRLYTQDSSAEKISESFNIEIEIGVLNKGDGYNFKYSFLPFEILNREAKVIVNHNYQTFLKQYIPDYPTVNGHGNQLTVGLEMELLKAKEKPRIIEPYANVSIGDKVISIYSQELDIATQRSHHFTINNDIGVNIQFPLNFKNKTNHLAFSFYNRFTVLQSLTPKKESALVSSQNSPYDYFRNNLGVGIRIKI